MKRFLFDLLRCPACGAALSLRNEVAGTTGEIVEGTLACSCGREYPVTNSIPRFVPADNYASNFGFQWNHFRSTQLDSTTGQPISRDRFLRATGWTEKDLRGALVLDAGCGAGRFAEVVLTLGATVVALDYSGAVDAAGENLKAFDAIHLVQGDILVLPFAPGTFDFVYSVGVLQHTPDARGAINSLDQVLRSGGRLAVDFYLRTWRNLFHPKYWLRPITKRMPQKTLFAILQRSVPALFRVSNLFRSIPLFGRVLSRFVPVANYSGVLRLSDEQLREWALLDTFDWLSPRYDLPQTPETLRAWLETAGLSEVEVFRADHLAGRGRKP
jgi:SAM-dependent methyltransferase